MAYCFIGLFALSGFFRGWWKEAITTFLLGTLVFLLQMPDVAQKIIDQVNVALQMGWGWLPASLQAFVEKNLGITSLQIDATSAQTWLIILILLLGLSTLLSWLLLPNQIRHATNYYTYAVTPLGGFLGGLLGGLNGFLIVNLVREYLDGGNLPTNTQQAVTEVAVAGGQTVGIASSGIGFQLTDLPGFIGLNSLVIWMVVAFGLVLLLALVRSRLAAPGWPPGYTKAQIKKKKDGEQGFTPIAAKK
jgi:hypothetical protein